MLSKRFAPSGVRASTGMIIWCAPWKFSSQELTGTNKYSRKWSCRVVQFTCIDQNALQTAQGSFDSSYIVLQKLLAPRINNTDAAWPKGNGGDTQNFHRASLTEFWQ